MPTRQELELRLRSKKNELRDLRRHEKQPLYRLGMFIGVIEKPEELKSEIGALETILEEEEEKKENGLSAVKGVLGKIKVGITGMFSESTPGKKPGHKHEEEIRQKYNIPKSPNR